MEIAELTYDELDQVNGGILPLLGAVAVIVAGALISEFAVGFADGMIDAFRN